MKNKINNKAQLTFFLLIGFIVLFIMGFLFYVNKKSTEYRTKTETITTQEVPYDITAIKSYVDNCLSKTARNGMKLLGEQGGRIYPWQGGRPLNIGNGIGDKYVVLEEEGREINVSYGIKISENKIYNCSISGNTEFVCNNTYGSINNGGFDGGVYPWIDFPNPAERNCQGIKGCFGQDVLPSITGQALDNMYHQLEFYINSSFESCVDFSIFKGFNITKNGTLEVSVNTTDQTVIVVIKYPIVITDPAIKKQTRLEKFYYDTKIRLKKLHELSAFIVREDIRNESFNPFSGSNLIGKDEKMKLSLVRNNDNTIMITPQSDNIIRIDDNFSRTLFRFQFARQNRAPILGKMVSPRQISLGFILNESNFSDVIDYDPDDEPKMRFFWSQELPSMPKLNPVQSFSYKTDCNLCDLGFRDFYITVCVSDNHSMNPFAPLCTQGDISNDWQIVKFDVDCINC
jgi:hypothetical protein